MGFLYESKRSIMNQFANFSNLLNVIKNYYFEGYLQVFQFGDGDEGFHVNVLYLVVLQISVTNTSCATRYL